MGPDHRAQNRHTGLVETNRLAQNNSHHQLAHYRSIGTGHHEKGSIVLNKLMSGGNNRNEERTCRAPRRTDRQIDRQTQKGFDFNDRHPNQQ
ncbi:hypothetical protein VTN00DRAFT_6536 [Thermoascus crustaceus]|uniref:uncharacterized protein n=1 Tax=Thermoascus crustaceus TaxID=5088 RepID=UPI0037423415